MDAAERKDFIRRVTTELWNEGKVELIDEMCAANCSFHDPNFPVRGLEGMKEQVRAIRHAQPDLHVDVHDILCDGDMTCARWTMGGTATNEFRGLPATGKSYVMSGVTMDKWQDDKIVEEWVSYDLLGALQQLGIIP